MKIVKWFYLGVPVLLGVGMLLASQPKVSRQTSPRRIDFDDKAGGCNGRPLLPDEREAVQAAINNIGSPPPESLSVKINNRDTTVACEDIADTLQKQLDRPGGIEAEGGARAGRAHATTKTDGKPSAAGDQMNISEVVLGVVMANPARSPYLEGILVHEFTHKVQDSATLANDPRSEKEAWYAQITYWDSIGIDTIRPRDPAYEEALKMWRQYDEQETRESRRVHYIGPGQTHEYYINFDTTGGAASDTLVSFELGELFYYSFPFGPMRASDAMIFENYFLLPDSHCLGLVCGGVPFAHVAQLLTLDIYHGEVVGPLGMLDFPEMFFYAMTHSDETELYYMLDTLNQQIVAMADMNADSVPETMISVYANAFEPGFEPLLNMRGVDAGEHPYHGAGVCVNHFDVHLGDLVCPYDVLFFLPDYDGNNMADVCLPIPRYEFLAFTPIIQLPPPWPGDCTVMLHATWEHDIEVWTSDSLGETLFEMLSVTPMMDGVDAECLLGRPLMAGEFIVPVDADMDEQQGPVVRVFDPTPHGLTMQYLPGIFLLRWEEVSGADHYNIYDSDDPVEFSLEPTFISYTNEFALPMIPDEKLFFRVTAER